MTVAVVGDTQYLVDGDPKSWDDPMSFRSPKEATDYEALSGLVSFLLNEAPSSQENIELVLHVGDIIFAGDRGWPLSRACAEKRTCRTPDGGWRELPQHAAPRGGGERCECTTRRKIDVQWERFTRQWRRLDGLVPYAIAQGNHDNAGELPTDVDDRDAALWPERDPAAGFYQHFGPDRIRVALERRGSANPDDTLGELVSVHTQSRSRARADGKGEWSNSRRGTSYAWKFRLGGRPVGVIGLTYQFGLARTGLEAYPDDLAWLERVVEEELAGLPLIALSHQFFNNRAGPAGSSFLQKSPWGILAPWRYLVARYPERVFLAAEGHWAGQTLLVRDRDYDPEGPHPRPLIWARAQGAGATRFVGPGRHVHPQLYLIRLFYRGESSTLPDEAEVIRVYVTDQPPYFSVDHTSATWVPEWCAGLQAR